MVKKRELVVMEKTKEKNGTYQSTYWWCRKHYGVQLCVYNCVYSCVYNRRDENKPYQICCLRKSSLGER